MVRLNKIPKEHGIKCEVLAKCEFLNPGGSTKDRIAKRMVEDAEEIKRIEKGDTIVEASSGNTGIGLAMVGAAKGYNVVITLPNKMSKEKSDTLNVLGAKVIRTPTDARFYEARSHVGIAIDLVKNNERFHMLDQYINPSNTMAHYDQTAEEIYDQCDGRLDAVIIGVGTGGTITGIARKFKELDPNIKIIGVDPEGSVLAPSEKIGYVDEPKEYKVEGVGYDFIPKVCVQEDVDEWVKSNDRESFLLARDIIKKEGLLVGGSSGSVLAGAFEMIKDYDETKRVVVLFVDGIRNYITKFLSDDWLLENNIITNEEYKELSKTKHNYNEVFGEDITIGDLELWKVQSVSSATSINDAWKVLKAQDKKVVPVLDDGKLVGVLTSHVILEQKLKGNINEKTTVGQVMNKEFRVVKDDDKLSTLAHIFNRHEFILVQRGEDLLVCESNDVLDKLFQ